MRGISSPFFYAFRSHASKIVDAIETVFEVHLLDLVMLFVLLLSSMGSGTQKQREFDDLLHGNRAF